MTTRLYSIIALLSIGAALAATPVLAAGGAVAGAKASGNTTVNRDAPLILPGKIVAKAMPHVDPATLSRGIFAGDTEAALNSLGTVTLSRDGTTAETPADDTMRAIFETTVEGKSRN